ncbi:DUF2752 domain-containing protein [Streptomyces sp. H39-C1]|nr:DUF2752 domain-containing protein [Streptomyces sp. H39-C1]MCZ4102791.1 DUF2752 domain-containing protein [Streptomyces sp. H39-C1]
MAIAAALAVFGLPPLDLHGPLHFLGVMDPACGMTRGVRLVLRGDLVAAFRYNPASPLVVAVMSLAVLRAAYGRLTGRWLTVRLRWSPGLLTALAIAVIALEVNQQLHASLLLARH